MSLAIPAAKNSKRRWLQFRLRTLLVGTAALRNRNSLRRRSPHREPSPGNRHRAYRSKWRAHFFVPGDANVAVVSAVGHERFDFRLPCLHGKGQR